MEDAYSGMTGGTKAEKGEDVLFVVGCDCIWLFRYAYGYIWHIIGQCGEKGGKRQIGVVGGLSGRRLRIGSLEGADDEPHALRKVPIRQ